MTDIRKNKLDEEIKKSKLDQEIKNPKLLLVEGKDEENFFEVLLEKKGIEDIQIQRTDGKENLKKRFPVIKDTRGFKKLKSLAIIHDADNNIQGSFDRICKVLRNNELPNPKQPSSFTSNSPKIGIFIIPDGKNAGNLESLCLSTVNSNTIQCIDPFMDCMKNKGYPEPKSPHKARCRAFLSAMKEDTPSLGVAAQKGYWDFDSKKLEPLINFLKQL